MATSGITTYSVSELEIIQGALEDLGVTDAGVAISSEDYLLGRRKLNMIAKQWTSQDFAPGLKMWCRRKSFLFLQKSQIVYSLGPSGDECAADAYYTSTTTVAAAGGASTITLASVTGFATTQRIGILLDSGSFQWTTINGAPAGLVVTLTAVLTGAAASGARVFAYASKTHRPFEIETAVRRDTDGTDTPMDPFLSLDEYELIPTKTSTGTPSRFYFEAQRTNAKAYLDCSPSDVTDVIRMTIIKYVDDFTLTTDTVDFPAEWYRPLSAQLAIDCAPSFQRPVSKELKLIRDESLKIAQHAYPSNSERSYESEPDCY